MAKDKDIEEALEVAEALEVESATETASPTTAADATDTPARAAVAAAAATVEAPAQPAEAPPAGLVPGFWYLMDVVGKGKRRVKTWVRGPNARSTLFWMVSAAAAATFVALLAVLVVPPTWLAAVERAADSVWLLFEEFFGNFNEHPLLESSCMLLAAVVMVAVVRSLKIGDEILGYLVAGAVVGPYGLNLVKDVANV